MQAFKLIKANAGAAGVDEQSLADFEKNLKGNLYKLWNGFHMVVITCWSKERLWLFTQNYLQYPSTPSALN